MLSLLGESAGMATLLYQELEVLGCILAFGTVIIAFELFIVL